VALVRQVGGWTNTQRLDDCPSSPTCLVLTYFGICACRGPRSCRLNHQSCIEIDFDSNRLPCINFLCFFFFLLLEVAVGELFVLRH